MMMKITYLGTNTLLFSKDDSTVLIDPHFTRHGMLKLLGKIRPDPQVIAENLSRFRIRRLDAVLLTHTHYDHALDAVEVIRQAGGVLYGSESAFRLAQGAGLGVHTCSRVTPRQVYSIGTFQVSFHPSQHVSFPPSLSWLMPIDGKIQQPLNPPAWFWSYQTGDTFAIQVDQSLTFGSAGFEPGAYQNLNVKAVILGIGGLDMKPQSYQHQLYAETVLAPGARQVFLSHWDNFFRPLGTRLRPMRFSRRSISMIKALAADHGQAVQQLEFGRSVDV